MSKYNKNRRKEIEEIISKRKNITIKELASHFNVTSETIRTDLSILETKGVLTRVHGGATYKKQTEEPSMEIRRNDRVHTKKQLATTVLNYIEDGSLIYIDNASTSLYLAKLLNTKKNCTIVTNSIELVNDLVDSKHEIILLGGKVSKKAKRTYGDFSLKFVQSFHFDVCILGMDGCQNTKAPANMNMEEVILNDTILKNSDFSILISDASKFFIDARYIYADFSDFDCFITTKIPVSFQKIISTKSIVEIGEIE